jgi:glycosyltransferase involved in cell wall biosynthesis
LLSAHGPFDALIADNGSYPGAWTCLAALRAAHRIGIGKRMLLVHHAASTYGFGRRVFEQMVDRGVQVWATDLVAVSRATRDTLIRLRFFNTERNPIRVIHNGIRISVGGVRDPAMRQRWGAGPQDFVVGMMGRIARYKGHEDMFLAMAELPQGLRDRLRFIIVGSGSDEEMARLRHIAERLGLANRVKFTGYIPDDPVFVARQFDLLAMVTKDFEGFGLAVAEAMVAGTPVLATAVGGVPEFVTSDTAMLVPPESPGEIARALAAIMGDPDAANARAKTARAHIESFSDEIMSRRFHRLLSI